MPETIRTDGVYVLFTSAVDTLAAIRVAARLARAMSAPITLIQFRPTPDREIEAFVARAGAGYDLRVREYLCRDERASIPMAFRGHSLIVVAGRPGWWPTRAERWRRWLEAAGHYVVFVDASDSDANSVAPEELRA